MISKLLGKIKTRKAKVGILGIGYVGSALGQASSSAGFKTLGFDIDRGKIGTLNKQKKSKFTATADTSRLAECEIICICVSTPIHQNKTPNLGFLKRAVGDVTKYLRKGQLIIIESTVGVGMTRNFAKLELELSGLVLGEDFFLAFSPERIDLGNPKFNLGNTPKLVAGADKLSMDLAIEFYRAFVKHLVPVSTLETAEMAKLLENIFRFVNIGLVNELTEYAQAWEVDMNEVVCAASTKPFGFLPHYPSPGIGGHCIPVDPYYLLDDARRKGISLGIINQAGKVNDKRPKKVVQKVWEILKNLSSNTSYRVLLLGVAYKAEVGDTRESPAFKIWKLLENKGIRVSYHDPYILRANGVNSSDLSRKTIIENDLIIIVTGHRAVDYKKIIKCQKPILDTQNVLRGKNYPFLYYL